jgi:hypothetical protein
MRRGAVDARVGFGWLDRSGLSFDLDVTLDLFTPDEEEGALKKDMIVGCFLDGSADVAAGKDCFFEEAEDLFLLEALLFPSSGVTLDCFS